MSAPSEKATKLVADYRVECEDWGGFMDDAILDRVNTSEAALLSYIAELEQDRARLDWITDESGSWYVQQIGTARHLFTRDDIDHAMQRQAASEAARQQVVGNAK